MSKASQTRRSMALAERRLRREAAAPERIRASLEAFLLLLRLPPLPGRKAAA